jgi:superfamily II DNA helicase RecQ
MLLMISSSSHITHDLPLTLPIGPDYKQMGKLKRDYPGIPLIALTATANDRVKSDVLSTLGMTGSLTLTQSFNRPNLKYEVRPKTKKVIEDIASFITQHHRRECGIIYCSSQAKCEETADKLRREYKIEARHYHAVCSFILPSSVY